MQSNLAMVLFLGPFAGALLCAIAGGRWPRAAGPIALAAMAATACLSVWAAWRVWSFGTLHLHLGGWAPPLGIAWRLDGFGALAAALVGTVGAVVLAGAVRPVREQLGSREPLFYACALLMVSGLMGMSLSADLFNVFVHLEVASLGAYALVAAGRRPAARAAMDYLIIGSLGASLYLLGVGFVYGATGSLSMDDVAARLAGADPRTTAIGVVLIAAGLAVKMGLFPLHGWVASAYAAAPSGASALLAPLSTKIAAYALARVLFWVFQAEPLRGDGLVLGALCWAGAIGMVYGAVKAAQQRDLWRLLAYSSVSQMGLIALGLGLANANGVTGAIMHIASDALMKGALFLAAAGVLARFGVREVQDLARLRGRAPWAMGVFVVVGLSLVGIPPLSGFYGKWYVLSGALDAGAWGLAAAIGVGTLASAVYVFRMFEQLFFAPVAEAERREVDNPGTRATIGASVLLCAGVVVVGVANAALVSHVIRPMLPGGL